MKAIAPAVAPVLVELTDGQPTTTSLDVAAHFGKRHDRVLDKIRNLECSPAFYLHNFVEASQEVEQPNAGVAKYPIFRLTRDGFTFLCMGFTGKEAAKWKEAYINAFNEMERALSGAVANPAAANGPSVPAEPIHLTYKDRPFRIVLEGTALWFVAADVAHALGLRDASRITRHLRSEHRSKRQVGRQMLNVIDRRGLDIALLHASPERSEPLRLWLNAALEQFVSVAAPRALPNGLSGEQQGVIKAVVAARIEALPKARRSKAAIACWSALKSKFGCRYEEIAPEQFSEAVSLVAGLALEGEWLRKEERKDGTILTGEDMAMLYHFCADALDMVQTGEQLVPALKALRAIALYNVPAHLENFRIIIGHFYQRFGQRMEEEAKKYNLYDNQINLAAAADRSQSIIRAA